MQLGVTRKVGGVGILLRDSLKCFQVKSFENYKLILLTGEMSVRVAIIYRLHPTKKNSLKAAKGNQKTVFTFVNKVLQKSHIVLPNNINSDKAMAHCFNNFFSQQILNIHSGFHSSTLSQGKTLVE